MFLRFTNENNIHTIPTLAPAHSIVRFPYKLNNELMSSFRWLNQDKNDCVKLFIIRNDNNNSTDHNTIPGYALHENNVKDKWVSIDWSAARNERALAVPRINRGKIAHEPRVNSEF